MTTVNDLMLLDLKRSGLSVKDVSKLKLKSLTPNQTNTLVGSKLSSYQIPYFDIDGKKTDFYRIRFLEEETGFSRQKQLRYTQPKSMPPQFYYPKSIDWGLVKGDIEKPITFTEGEKKAALLCSHNINCIGLGGVWNWKSKSTVDGLAEDYHNIEWVGREVYIVFDNDITEKYPVQCACFRLCEQLLSSGAIVYTQHIPLLDGGVKMGVDDYVKRFGIETFHEIFAEEYAVSKVLHYLNSRYIYCSSPPCFIEISTKQLFKRADFSTHIATVKYKYETKEGNASVKPAFEVWIAWEHRNACVGIAYEPNEPMITSDNKFNTYEKSNIKPIKSSKKKVKPFLDLVDFIFSNETDKVKSHFIKWCAYPFQHPGNKMYHAVLVHSTETGVGKSLIGLIIGKLYGGNFYEGGSEILESDHNLWANNNQFILVDEVSSENVGYQLRRESNNIKRMITRETNQINLKHIQQFTINDYLHYYFTSNHPNAIHLDKNDRRFLVIGAPTTKLTQSFYDLCHDTYMTKNNLEQTKDNLGALLYHLINEVDLTDFNPREEPPHTQSRDSMISNSMTDLLTWCNNLFNTPDEVLNQNDIKLPGDLWTCKDLSHLYSMQTGDKVTQSALNLKLQEIGFRPIKVTNPHRTYYAVRNHDKWVVKKVALMHTHYKDTRGKKIDSRLLSPINKGK